MYKSKLEDSISLGIKKLIKRFIQVLYKTKSIVNQQVILGSFVYLLDEQDIVPDNTPNIGLLDDIMLFLNVFKNFEIEEEIRDLLDFTEFEDLYKLVEKNRGLIFSTINCDINKIREIGKKNLQNKEEILRNIIDKYKINN